MELDISRTPGQERPAGQSQDRTLLLSGETCITLLSFIYLAAILSKDLLTCPAAGRVSVLETLLWRL